MEKLLTISEVADLFRCSIRTIHRRIRDRRHSLPVMKIGGRFLFDSREIEKWSEKMREITNTTLRPGVI